VHRLFICGFIALSERFYAKVADVDVVRQRKSVTNTVRMEMTHLEALLPVCQAGLKEQRGRHWLSLLNKSCNSNLEKNMEFLLFQL
jgi:hypothetical protein